MSRHDCESALWPPDRTRPMAALLAGVPEPVGTVRRCPGCDRPWIVYRSTSPVSSWAFRAWRPLRWWERLRHPG